MFTQHHTSQRGFNNYITIVPLVMLFIMAFQPNVRAQASLDKFVKNGVDEYYVIRELGDYNQPPNILRYATLTTQDYAITDTIIKYDPTTESMVASVVTTTYYINADVMPQYVGGDAALQTWLGTNLLYPQEAKAANIKGTVVVEFEVNVDGDISRPRIINGVHPILDRAAFATVCEMPRWQAGTINGQAKNIVVSLPIRFQ